jgi:hypothetical protein
MNGAKRNAYRILVGKPRGKKPLGRPGHKCMDNIVTDLLKVLLGNRPVNIYHSNECATVGCPLLGNAWVDTPDNNT